MSARNVYRRKKANQVTEQAVSKLLSLQLSAGMTVNELTRFARKCVEQAQSNYQLGTDDDPPADVHGIGSILRAWHKETQYLTKYGFPKALHESGKCGLRRLIGRYYPPASVTNLIHRLGTAGIIKKDEAGRWMPVASHAVVPKMSSEMYEHIADGVSRFVETVTSNLSLKRQEDALFERAAKVRRFPVESLPEFRDFVRKQASAFLVSIDDWMETRATTKKKSRSRKCSVGVFTFAFLEHDE